MGTFDPLRWAKKFDTVAHLYDKEGGGTLCGSVAACLGNNYSTTDMKTCEKCIEIHDEQLEIKNDSEQKHWNDLATFNERFNYD